MQSADKKLQKCKANTSNLLKTAHYFKNKDSFSTSTGARMGGSQGWSLVTPALPECIPC